MDWLLYLQTPIIDPLIPPAPLSLVGRDVELSHLKERLRSEAVISLNGLPGIGKTTLAVAVANDPEIRTHFPDGVLWAPLGTTPDPFGQLRRWGALFGLHESQIDSRNIDTLAQAVRNVIEQRRMLLILDDAWTMEDILTFQIGGPHCASLVTTRFSNVATQLARCELRVLHELSIEQSLDFLHLLAPQVVEGEASKTRALAEAVGGLPLALMLIGNYLRWQAHSGQSRRIHEALERLNHVEMRLHLSEPRGPLQRHPSFEAEQLLSLHAIIALTDQYLSEQARASLYALCVLPHKPDIFSKSAALAVGTCSTEVLDALIDTRLLESGGACYYTLHQTIADYARLHLQGTAPHERLIQYAHDVLSAHKNDYELLDVESGTILAALEAAYTLGKKEELVRNVCDFIPYLLVRGNYSLAERHLQRAHDAAVALADDPNIITTFLYLGQIAQKQGNYTQAEGDFQEALTLARKGNDPERISAALNDLGSTTWKRGNYPQAEAYLKEGLLLARQIKDAERMCDLLQALGAVAASRGDYLQSEMYLQEGVNLARQTDDRKRLCVLLMNLGVTISERGDVTQGEMYLQEGLALARSIGHKEWMCALLCNLGAAATLQERYVQAEMYQREGLSIARQIGHREWMSMLLLNLGETAAAQDKNIQATLYFQETVKLVQHLGRPQLMARALYELGNLYLKQQEIEQAETTFQEMLNSIPQGDLELHALSQYGFARLSAAQGNFQKARQLGEASATAFESMKHPEAKHVRDWLASIASA